MKLAKVESATLEIKEPRRHLSRMDLRFGYKGETYHGIINLVDWK